MNAALMAASLALLAGARHAARRRWPCCPARCSPIPALEARARALSAELRCMVCQNQSIDDSDADLAHDLRVLVRERLAAGDSDEEVIDYIVSRYGEFVLLKPRFSLRNALAVGRAGACCSSAGGAFIVLATARRRRVADAGADRADEKQRAGSRFLRRSRTEQSGAPLGVRIATLRKFHSPEMAS